MNRRQFTTALAALAATPALPAKAITGLPAAAGAAISKPARFWAIYMSHLHGTCTPQVLAKAAKISPAVARSHLSSMVSQGILTPTNIAAKTVATQANPIQNTSNIRTRLDRFLKEKSAAKKGIMENLDDSTPVNHDGADLPHDTDIATDTPSPTAKNPG
jgi:hypothetical protein